MQRTIIYAAIACLCLAVAACGDDDSITNPTSATTEPEPDASERASDAATSPLPPRTATDVPATSVPADTTIRFASIESAGQSAVPKVMTDSGIADKYGLDVEIVPYARPGEQYTLIASGATDVIAGNILDLHRQRESGTPIKAFWGFQRYNNVIVAPPDSPITRYEDLEGRKIGQFGTTFPDWLVLRVAGQRAYGIDIEADATPVQASPPLLNEALANGDVDAALQFSSLALAPIVNGDQRVVADVGVVVEAGGFDPDSLYLVWMVDEGWLDDNPDGLERLQSAMAETYATLQTDDDVWPELGELVGITRPDLLDAYVALEREHINPSFTADLMEPTQQLIDAMTGLVGVEVIGFEQLDPEAFAFLAP